MFILPFRSSLGLSTNLEGFLKNIDLENMTLLESHSYFWEAIPGTREAKEKG